MGFFDSLHKITKWVDPLAHYTVDAIHQSSTDLVNETSRAIEKMFGSDTAVGGFGEHWKNMSQKDKEDFGRWATNTGLSAAAIYGGMSAAGSGGAGAGAGVEAGAGAGSGAVAGFESLPIGAAGTGTGTAAAGAAGAGGVAAAGTGSGYGSVTTAGLNALLQAYQSKQASDAQIASGDAANATQRYMFDLLNAQQEPYRAAGYNALGSINNLMTNPASITSDPGYQFGLSQGQKAIDNSASARGGIGGAALKAGTRYAQDYAGTKLNETYNRYAGIAGLGQVANGRTASVGTNYANQVSSNQLGQGNAAAANALNQGNIWGNAINAIGAYGSANNWWQGG